MLQQHQEKQNIAWTRYEIISLTVQSRWGDDDDDIVVVEEIDATSWKHTIKITILFNVMQH